LHRLEDLARLGVAAARFLGEHQLSVHGNFEQTTRGLHQPDLGFGECLLQLSRQTGGSGLIVSDNAVLNRYKHEAGRLAQKRE
jgi:hypothetical protein